MLRNCQNINRRNGGNRIFQVYGPAENAGLFLWHCEEMMSFLGVALMFLISYVLFLVYEKCAIGKRIYESESESFYFNLIEEEEERLRKSREENNAY